MDDRPIDIDLFAGAGGMYRALDLEVRRELRALGWRVMIIWECRTKNLERLRSRLVGFLENSP
jgi:hypothetical protein